MAIKACIVAGLAVVQWTPAQAFGAVSHVSSALRPTSCRAMADPTSHNNKRSVSRRPRAVTMVGTMLDAVFNPPALGRLVRNTLGRVLKDSSHFSCYYLASTAKGVEHCTSTIMGSLPVVHAVLLYLLDGAKLGDRSLWVISVLALLHYWRVRSQNAVGGASHSNDIHRCMRIFSACRVVRNHQGQMSPSS